MPNKCPQCGKPVGPNSIQGLCPQCMMQVGLGSLLESAGTVCITPPAPPRALPEPGSQFGSYTIVRRLGQGGMGVVFEAQEQDTGRRIALKVLGEQLDSAEDRARFLREGRLAASINHPNCVYVYGSEEIEGTPVITMELVAGGTLQQRVKRGGPMSVAGAVDAILQIISGLEAAEKAGILHRDIKPGNCFEDADGTIKIGDFGLSIATAGRAEPSITITGKVLGTPAFSSPEQLRGQELSARSDIYAVGVTLFYLLTGRVPFEGQNVAQLVANALEKPAPSPRDFRSGLPRGLAAAVARCLRKQPSERFKSYDELRQTLAPYSSVAPTPATLGLRTVAGLLDMVLLSFFNFTVTWLWLTDPAHGFLAALSSRGGFVRAILLGLIYFSLSEGIWGASAGKAICRLRVVGANRNPPGVPRAFLRSLPYVMAPMIPYWILTGGDPLAALHHGPLFQAAIQFATYGLLALLFVTMRRRNGFAAVQDLLTGTRVLSRLTLEARPAPRVDEPAPGALDQKRAIGPYQVLETLETSGDVEWLLGYDVRLLRKVWIRVAPAGTPPIGPLARNIGRPGGLRWLTGQENPRERWDAFESLTGMPLLRLARCRQPWAQVRFWLDDLAREISAAEKDHAVPPLGLDRVWITAEGRAKLLSFPAPGLAAEPPVSQSCPQIPPADGTMPAGDFLAAVAISALEGRVDADMRAPCEVAVPLPLHARDFLRGLRELSNADAVVAALRPLLQRLATVSRSRRLAVVAGCIAFPVFGACAATLGTYALQKLNQQDRPLADLLSLLSQHSTLNSKWIKNAPHPGDDQFAIYIASHFRSVITNDAAWNAPMALALINGEKRQFAEKSVAEYPAPTPEQVAQSEAALKSLLSEEKKVMDNGHLFGWIGPFLVAITLLIYGMLPALIAALLFRGGLVLRAAGVALVRTNGARASRWRAFLRGVVAWSPLVVSLLVFRGSYWWAVYLLTVSLCVISVLVPVRGLQDRLAGTWPVPR
jgi:eukaryotic-like serine/threonine-protein kinase